MTAILSVLHTLTDSGYTFQCFANGNPITEQEFREGMYDYCSTCKDYSVEHDRIDDFNTKHIYKFTF